MRRLLATALTAALLALPAAEPAAAFPVDTAPAAVRDAAMPVAFRHIGGHRLGGIGHGLGGHRLGGLRRGFGARRFGGIGRGFGGRRFYGGRRSGFGGAAAGLVAGAIIGSVIAGAARASSSVASCERRFKSYNSVTGTYLGYDGLRHRCP